MAIDPGTVVLSLLNARTAAHLCHLQTDSYARHVALGEFYQAIGDIGDRYAECWMGCYGQPIKLKGATFTLQPDPVKLLEDLSVTLREAREAYDESHLQQILDDGLELTCSTIYKITRLK